MSHEARPNGSSRMFAKSSSTRSGISPVRSLDERVPEESRLALASGRARTVLGRTAHQETDDQRDREEHDRGRHVLGPVELQREPLGPEQERQRDGRNHRRHQPAPQPPGHRRDHAGQQEHRDRAGGAARRERHGHDRRDRRREERDHHPPQGERVRAGLVGSRPVHGSHASGFHAIFTRAPGSFTRLSRLLSETSSTESPILRVSSPGGPPTPSSRQSLGHRPVRACIGPRHTRPRSRTDTAFTPSSRRTPFP